MLRLVAELAAVDALLADETADRLDKRELWRPVEEQKKTGITESAKPKLLDKVFSHLFVITVGERSTSRSISRLGHQYGEIPEVAKQHDVFAGAKAFGVLVSARASFWLDKKIRNLFECFQEDFPKPALVPPTDKYFLSGFFWYDGIRHYRVVFCLCFKMSPGAKRTENELDSF